jgi:hypothetical protein
LLGFRKGFSYSRNASSHPALLLMAVFLDEGASRLTIPSSLAAGGKAERCVRATFPQASEAQSGSTEAPTTRQ